MPTYRHKALKLTAKLAVGYIDMYLIREDDNKISRMFGDTILPLEYIIHFWFEEVKEEKEESDWINTAIKEMEQYFTYNETGICLTSMPPQYPRHNKTDLRQAIEKHMPQQKKFTVEYVNNFVVRKGTFDTPWPAIKGFLRDHWLLEE